MFKSILTVLIIVQFTPASDFKFSFDGELGYVPRSMSLAYKFPMEYKYVSHKNVFFLNLTPKLDFKFIYGLISVTAFSCKAKDVCFHPFRAVFENEIGLYKQFSDIRLSIYWKHQCSHTVTVSNPFEEEHNLFDNGYDKIALKFSYNN